MKHQNNITKEFIEWMDFNGHSVEFLAKKTSLSKGTIYNYRSQGIPDKVEIKIRGIMNRVGGNSKDLE